MSKAKALSIDEKRWQAEDDARALKAYAELVKNKTRMEIAKKKLIEEQNDISKAIKLAK